MARHHQIGKKNRMPIGTRVCLKDKLWHVGTLAFPPTPSHTQRRVDWDGGGSSHVDESELVRHYDGNGVSLMLDLL